MRSACSESFSESALRAASSARALGRRNVKRNSEPGVTRVQGRFREGSGKADEGEFI
jgi:hypothetical protein